MYDSKYQDIIGVLRHQLVQAERLAAIVRYCDAFHLAVGGGHTTLQRSALEHRDAEWAVCWDSPAAGRPWQWNKQLDANWLNGATSPEELGREAGAAVRREYAAYNGHVDTFDEDN